MTDIYFQSKGNAKYYLNAPLKFTSKHVSLDEEYEGDGPLTKADRKALEMTVKASMPMVKKFVFDSLELKPDGGIARVRAYYTKDKYILASIKTTNLDYPSNGEDVRPNEEDIKEEIPSNENGDNTKPETGKTDVTPKNPAETKRNGNTGNEYLDGLPAGDERDDLIMNTVVLENMPGVPSDTSANANTSTAPKSASELSSVEQIS